MSTCDHMIDRQCTNPQGSALWGRRPMPGICAVKCKFRSGPPIDPATFIKATVSAPPVTPKTYGAKVSEFLESWCSMIREGAVSVGVAVSRMREGCMRCPAAQLATDGKTRYCLWCGCGDRRYALLYREGEDLDGKSFPRLFMPNPHCPRKEGDPLRLAPSPGSRSLDAVGGLQYQRRMLARAVAGEVGRGFKSAWRILGLSKTRTERTEATT